MRANPYLNRRPIRHPDEFYGRDEDVRWLLERMTHPSDPQCCSITGLRRIGKSSLLKFLAHPEGALPRYREEFPHNDRLLLIYADLSLDSVGEETEAGRETVAALTLGHMLRALTRRARSILPPDPNLVPSVRPGDWQEALEALEDLLYSLKEGGFQVIFLLDELDVAETWPASLTHALRSLVMEHNVAYVTASLRPLFELFEEGRASPLYNLFSTRPLGLLTPEQARALLVEPAQQAEVTWSAGIIEQLLDAVGGHPDLVKMTGDHLWTLMKGDGKEPRVEMVLEDLRADANALFTSIWGHLTPDERRGVAVLAAHRNPSEITDILPALQQRAMITETHGGTRLFGSLFADWVQQQPEALEKSDAPHLDGRWLVINNQRQQLTPTEARLADILLSRRGQTVSREELQEAIWEQVDPDSKALDTTVQRLREKIEKDRANPQWLITVRGEGYTFR
ncbi:MAG: winged helix-turn-helix domain-containing protein [Ardenticatenales bacterium]|nr:winged helix-turn-helix domain-containing protein [Ardenticatenales bacterium]